MAFRGYMALNGVEIANSARVVAHLGMDTPTLDAAVFDTVEGCELVPAGDGLYQVPASSGLTATGMLTPPDGARFTADGLLLVTDECWSGRNLCNKCATHVPYDDSWPDLRTYLHDAVYRPELAPWAAANVPESMEFGGIWVMSLDGLGPAPVDRPIIELAGPGAAAGQHRDTSRTLRFEALLIACTNAGLEYGLEWLACQLRDTKDRTDSVLRYFAAHPAHTAADPDALVREVHGVVLTKAPEVSDAFTPTGQQHNQALMYRVTWEMVVLHPYAYTPPIVLPVDWDLVESQPINWVHGPDCPVEPDCLRLPALYSEECKPEFVQLVTDPPPVCGGCMPVCAVDTYTYELPVFEYPFRCGQTVISLDIVNEGEQPLTLQAWFKLCNPVDACGDDLWPLQISGLPPAARLVLDGITGRFTAIVDGRKRRPVGIVSTPNGAPWRPAIIDRTNCYELIIMAPNTVDFSVTLTMTDREA